MAVVALAVASIGLGIHAQERSKPPKINLNTATVEELKTLPKIGEVTARNIIAHRRIVGPFRSIEELMAVPRIGRKIFARIRDRVTVVGVGSVQAEGESPPGGPS